MDESETETSAYWRIHLKRFKDFLEKERVAVDKALGLKDFIPAGEIQGYLREPGRLKNMLYELFGHTNYDWRASDIVERFSVVFAILVYIHEGHHIINCLDHDSQRDDRLPFSACPEDFHNALWDKFRATQPRFCAATFRKRSQPVYGDEQRLPFLEKVVLGSGGSAEVFRVRIHANHNKLHNSGSQSTAGKPHEYYALKAYREPGGQKLHDNEISAFRKLKRTGLDDTHMIGYYCSYVHMSLHYALFEYADVGSLEDFIQDKSRPQTIDEITAFWNGMLRVIDAIVLIHDPPSSSNSSSGPSNFIAVHQDITPQNILMKSKAGGAKYDFVFGLADLGTSSFSRATSTGGNQDNYGTKTYGAPECIRRDRFDDSRNKDITTSADIWSFACVLSEICVWICFGYTQEHGVEGYRERRKNHNREAVRGLDCFHVDGEVSPAVADEHQKIIKQGRCDGITEQVLGILTEMLMIDPLSRPTAAEVRRWFGDILGDGKGKSPARTSSSTHKMSASFSTAHGAQSPLRPHQNTILRSSGMPHHRQSSAVYNMSGPYGELMSSPRSMTGFAEVLPTPHDTSTVIAGATRFLAQEESSGTFTEPGPAYGNHSAKTLPVRSSDRHHGSGARSPTSPLHPAPDPRKSGRSSKQQSRRTTVTSASVPDDRVNSQNGLSRTATPSVSGDGSENDNVEVQNRAPVCLHMDAALAWRRGAREGAKLSNRGLLSQLENRDHVFIVDDSGSMDQIRTIRKEQKQHDVSTYVEVLSYMVKNKDPNGVDLYYFNSTEEFTKCRRSTVLAKSVAAKTFDGLTTPETKLKGLLVKYCTKLKEYTIKRNAYDSRGPNSVRTRLSLGRPPTLPRALSVYVLTDGVWESPNREGGDYLIDTIRKLVEQLKEAECERGQVGVQFIRFGNHLYGKKRLEALDLLSKNLGLGLDIIDTEPVDKDNVWKMLLGPINSRFDAD